MIYNGRLIQVVRHGEKLSVRPIGFCRSCGEILRSEHEIKDGQCWECWFTDDADEEDCDDDDRSV